MERFVALGRLSGGLLTCFVQQATNHVGLPVDKHKIRSIRSKRTVTKLLPIADLAETEAEFGSKITGLCIKSTKVPTAAA